MTHPTRMRCAALIVAAAMLLSCCPALADTIDMSQVTQSATNSTTDSTTTAEAAAAAEAADTSAATTTTTGTAASTTVSTSSSTSYGTGTISKDGTNMRTGPSTSDTRICQLSKGTGVTLLSIPSVIDSNHWFQVSYNGTVGYVQAPYITIVSTGSLSSPTGSVSNTDVYVKLTKTSANLRDKPNGTRVEEWLPADGNFLLKGTASTSGGYDWYPVQYKTTNHIYYVRSDCVTLVDAAGNALTAAEAAAALGTSASSTTTAATSTTTTTTTTTTSATGSYVKLTKSSVNLRATPGGTKVAEWVGQGNTLPLAAAAVTSGGYTWYPVTWNGSTVYARGDCVTLVSSASSAVVADGGESGTTTTTTSEYGYVKTILSDVNLRLQPAGTYISRVAKGVVLPLLANPTTSGGYTWYYVQADVKGYIRGDCVAVCDANGTITATTTDASTSTGTSTTTTTTSAYGTITLTSDKVNLRSKPAGTSLTQLSIGTVLSLTGNAVTSGAYKWYPVSYNNTTGYIRGDCATQTSGTSATDSSSSTSSSSSTTTTTTTSSYGYIYVSKAAVNFRKTPSGDKIGTLDKTTIWPMTGNTTTAGGYTWYPVNVNGTTGYVRGDCCFKLSDDQVTTYLAGGTVTATSSSSSSSSSTTTTTSSGKTQYIKTTVDKVNIRSAASKDASAPYNVSLGTVFYYEKTVTSSGSTWYQIIYKNQTLYVLGSCVSVMTESEYATYLASNPSSTPQTETVVGYVKTTTSSVNLRATAGGTVSGSVPTKGTVLPYTTNPTTARGYTWYYVTTSSGTKGFIRGDCVSLCDSDGTVTASSTTAASTTTNASDLTMAIYPAEKIDWYTGGIQTLWPKGSNVKVYDVKTGIVWWAHRWSGGYHADVEPLTAADSARLCKIYGVSSTDEIASKNLWQRRPCLITIGTRTFACSLYGVPHNYPDGDTISNNDMKGQVCIHFTNSRTHTGNAVDSYHTEAIQYAWEHAPNGHI